MSARRLFAYASSTILVLGACELIVRINEPLFFAISHRVLTKAELLDRKPAAEVIFFGTSRTWDGVSARLFAEELNARRHDQAPISAFNLATTGSSLETLVYLAERFAARPGLRLAMIEQTVSQLKREPLAWAPSVIANDATAEEHLQFFAREHVKLIELRGSFVGENFVRMIPLVFLAPILDGSEVNPKDFWREMRGDFEQRAPEVEWASWRAQAIEAAPDTAMRSDELAKLIELVRLFEKHDVEVIFFVPPLRDDDPREERRASMQSLYANVERASGAPVWDFASASSAGDDFRDTSHLSRRGRARFSSVLARTLAESTFAGCVAPSEPSERAAPFLADETYEDESYVDGEELAR